MLPFTVASLCLVAHPAKFASVRVPRPLMLGEAASLSAQLAAVRAIRPNNPSPAVQTSLWEAAGLNPTFKVSGSKSGEPSFTRLMDHASWRAYTGKPPLRRWVRVFQTWRYSTVLLALWPISTIAAAWAFLLACLPPMLIPRTSPIPMSLFGQALGLLLVFRTNNSYQRLNEARGLWGRMVYLCREVAQGVATTLLFDEELQDATAPDAAARVCRYLAAFCWETNAKLTGPTLPDDVLHVLLPPAEAAWMVEQRSRPCGVAIRTRRSSTTMAHAHTGGRSGHHRIPTGSPV